MPAASNAVKRGGRRGRRTAGMVRIARERISTLFALAEREATSGRGELADRYVTIARRVGTRYNVRVLPEYRELYCRGCSSFWVEGRTVRTRLRSGHRVRTCLSCGRERRILLRESIPSPRGPAELGPTGVRRDQVVLAEVGSDDDSSDDEPEEE
jgi:ribonuclease P protein subunit RPR2